MTAAAPLRHRSGLWAAIAFKTELWKFGTEEFGAWLSISIFRGHPSGTDSRMLHLIQQTPFSTITGALATRGFTQDGVTEPEWKLENFHFPVVPGFAQFVIPINRIDGDKS